LDYHDWVGALKADSSRAGWHIWQPRTRLYGAVRHQAEAVGPVPTNATRVARSVQRRVHPDYVTISWCQELEDLQEQSPCRWLDFSKALSHLLEVRVITNIPHFFRMRVITNISHWLEMQVIANIPSRE
jgi:hypothetical protein